MNNKHNNRLTGSTLARAARGLAAAAVLVLGFLQPAAAQTVPTAIMSGTKHDLSKTGAGTVKSSTETQVCAFCHTPHGANTTAVAPLWNRNNFTGSYTTYKSASIDADGKDAQGYLPQPAGSSLMCLSCHDGTIALGSVRVLRGGAASVTVDNSATTAIVGNTSVGANTVVGGMPPGTYGATSGFTRLLGTNLGNDHPISVTYDSGLATRDTELRPMDANQKYPATTGTVLGVRKSGYKPQLPLLNTGTNGAGQVQCATCHDPHITRAKFLRLNRLQVGNPGGGDFNKDNDIICLACHDKGGTEWANSVHANTTTASYTYNATAAGVREFPAGTTVAQAACLNCHDTHTVPGARRLLREGTDQDVTGYAAKTGGKSAIEATCYQCHNAPTPASGPSNVLNALPALSATTGVPNIKGEFERIRRMPIKTYDQGTGNSNTDELHEITNADFIETPASLGLTDTKNRHVECTDCHNPHRVIRNARYDGAGASQRTHVAGGTAANKGADGNIASGVLRGMWGVEPSYGAITTWPQAPTFTVVSGIPGKAATPLTKEYQLCFKCHSNYSNTSFPALRGATYGGTPSTTNGLTFYTNVAAEFAVKAWDTVASGGDQGEYGESTYTGTPTNEDSTAIEPTPTAPGDASVCTTSGNPCMTDNAGTQNHRSWHPVIWPTGRTRDERRMASTGGNFRAPFATYVGTQTMHCSDCHGHSASWTTGGPDMGQVQGPHGSDKNFLLKGDWNTSVSIGGSGLCFNCHNPTATSGTGDNAARVSGFNNSGEDGGGGHANEHSGRYCMRCHIAVPHGWKNKAFLVNLNCVGPEAGKTSCDGVSGYAGYNGSNTFSVEPYYYQASLRVRIWQASGNWTQASCGMNGYNARDWMRDGAGC